MNCSAILPTRKTPGSSFGAPTADAGISFCFCLTTCHDHTLSIWIWRSANFLVQITDWPFFVKNKIGGKNFCPTRSHEEHEEKIFYLSSYLRDFV
jgi:hypothetical protein